MEGGRRDLEAGLAGIMVVIRLIQNSDSEVESVAHACEPQVTAR